MSNQWQIVWILPQSVFESPLENLHLTYKCLKLDHLRYFWLLIHLNFIFRHENHCRSVLGKNYSKHCFLEQINCCHMPITHISLD